VGCERLRLEGRTLDGLDRAADVFRVFDQLLTGRVSQTAICRAAHRRDGICAISPAAKVAIT
jgi:hypothetical protein